MPNKIPLQLYNTLTRKKEVFKPIKKGEVGMYSCGPTVYWYQHIGNLRTYIFSDILKRVLKYNDFKKLNIIEPKIWSKATEHIKEQIELIKKLEKKGYTYKTSDGIYFDTNKFKDYGKFARLDVKGLEAGKRIDLGEK